MIDNRGPNYFLYFTVSLKFWERGFGGFVWGWVFWCGFFCFDFVFGGAVGIFAGFKQAEINAENCCQCTIKKHIKKPLSLQYESILDNHSTEMQSGIAFLKLESQVV